MTIDNLFYVGTLFSDLFFIYYQCTFLLTEKWLTFLFSIFNPLYYPNYVCLTMPAFLYLLP